MRSAAILLTLWDWLRWTTSGVTGLRDILDASAALKDSHTKETWWSSALGLYEVMAIAAVALALLVIADGPRALGLRPHRSVDRHIDSFCGYLRRPFLFGATANLALLVVRLFYPTLTRWTAIADPGTQPWWTGAASVATAVAEEAVLLAVMFRALDYVRVGSRTLARNKYAIVILVVMRMAYHVYQGVAVVALLPMAFLMPLMYRRDRILLPAIAIHALFDTMVIVIGNSWRFTIIEGILVGLFLIREVFVRLRATPRSDRRVLAES